MDCYQAEPGLGNINAGSSRGHEVRVNLVKGVGDSCEAAVFGFFWRGDLLPPDACPNLSYLGQIMKIHGAAWHSMVQHGHLMSRHHVISLAALL